MENLKNQIQENLNSNGGGLAKNITGKFESNRHALAKIEKFTFGQVVAKLKKKKNGGFVISANELLEIYTFLFGCPEWHHAGMIPKNYGGGMKKTYFLKEIPTIETLNSWLEKFKIKKEESKEIQKKVSLLLKQKNDFIEKFGLRFSRETIIPKFSIIDYTEMEGKFGWFIVKSIHNYDLTKYYTGIAFKSKKTLEKFNSLA